MTILIVIILILLLFTIPTFVGSPYLPSIAKKSEVALDLLDLKSDQTLLELGVGDGRVAIAAAKRNIKVVGYEINPIIYAIAVFRTRKYRNRIKIIYGDMFSKDWPKANGIYSFLMPTIMSKVDKKIRKTYKEPIKLVSFGSKVEGGTLLKREVNVYLYGYNES